MQVTGAEGSPVFFAKKIAVENVRDITISQRVEGENYAQEIFVISAYHFNDPHRKCCSGFG